MNKVEIVNLVGKRDKKVEKELKKVALKTIQFLGGKNISVEIFLAKSQLMKFLNKKFCGKNKTADVLSFEEPKDFISPKSKNKNIGEIYLNSKFSILNSRYLLIHGLLHLFGYDHQKKNDIIKMELAEQRLLKILSTKL